MSGLFAVAIVLYYVDYKLILNRKEDFSQSQNGKNLYDHLVSQHVLEMKFLAPAGLLFNLIASYLIWKYPVTMITNQYHIVLICLQVFFQAGILFNSIKSFKKRSLLIEKVID